ncbi:MAG: succinate--CoA ligase subunit alpha [Alphaproteobacteria bacterium]|nr:succinate--CoA ligase subunit alpha [Alphaproteobacteria bacterium]
MYLDIDGTTPVLIQGITGRAGQAHMRLMRGYGTNIVAGVSTSRSVGEIDGVPVFPDCRAAVAATGAVASVAMVPALDVERAIREAVEAGIRLIVTIAEGVPVHAALQSLRLTREADVTWIGASTPGLAIPGKAKLGFLPDVTLLPGPLGVMSKSGTLSYEVCYRLAQRGIGQSAWIGVGGDQVKGTRFAELVPYFATRPDTDGLLVVGEIGGTEEEELAEALRAHRYDRPVFALIAGATAREGIVMGHAGAMIHGAAGTIASKRAALERAGARVFATMGEIVEAVAETLRP